MREATYIVRTAEYSDWKEIKAIIRQTRLNPFGLDWQKFVIAVSVDNTIVGIGQLKRHRGGIVEMASIAVIKSWRGKGVSKSVIDQLLQQGKRNLWLTCRSSMRSFYRQFSFREIRDRNHAPFPYRVILRISSLIRLFSKRRDYIAVMFRR